VLILFDPRKRVSVSEHDERRVSNSGADIRKTSKLLHGFGIIRVVVGEKISPNQRHQGRSKYRVFDHTFNEEERVKAHAISS
jgi:hypothetical protein